MNYNSCGPLAYLLAAKAIPGQYLAALPADETSYFEKLFRLAKPSEPLLRLDQIADYFRHVAAYSPAYVPPHELSIVACIDLLLRATEDASEQLGPRIVEIMSFGEVTRGSFEHMMLLLQQHEKVFA